MFQQHQGEYLSEAISLPQDLSSTSDRRLIKLENQVKHLMEAHFALTQPTQVKKITTSCEMCSGPHDTQYCMEDPKQAFVEYASLRTDEAGVKWYTFILEQNNLGDTYNPSWKSHPNLRLSKFEADFKQQQSDLTNKINTVLKAITDRMAGALPSDTVKNLKLNVNTTTLVLSTRPYLIISQLQPEMGSGTQQPEEPEPTLEDEFHDLHLNLPVLEVLCHALIYNAILDKYVESLELGKNGLAFVQGKVSANMEDPELFTLPCRLANRTKSYPVGIVKDVEFHIGKLKLLNDFYVIDIKKDPKTPLLVGRGFLAIANAVID
ncbi:hypothetical protein Tco_0638467, partial [Tanacetum coccineum]